MDKNVSVRSDLLKGEKMKKTIIKTVTFLVVVVLLMSFCNMFASAATATLTSNSKTVNIGEKVSVKVVINASDKMQTIVGNITYNSEVLQYESATTSGITGGAGVLNINANPASNNYTVVISFVAAKSGSSVISTADIHYQNANGMVLIANASTSVVVINPTKADDANLASLRLGVGNLTPAFSPDVTEYTATIPHTAEECKVYVSASDTSATISVEGSATMKVGKNKRVVVVTAPNGTVKRYTITIARQNANGEVVGNTQTEETTPYDVSIDGKKYVVLSDLTGVEIPIGFNIDSAAYLGNPAQIATDNKGEYELYFLKNKSTGAICPYTYKDGFFTAVKYYNFNDKTYIFANEKAKGRAEAGYYRASRQIGEFKVDCFASRNPKFSDFCWIFCYVDGAYDFYSYDAKQGIIQRDPNFIMIDETDKSNDNSTFLQRFKTINHNGQILIIALVLAAVLIIAIIVLLLIRFFGSSIEDDVEPPAMDEYVGADEFLTERIIDDEKDSAPISEEDFSAAEDDLFVTGEEDDEADI